MDKLTLRMDNRQREVSFPLDASFPIQAVTWRLSTFARGRFDCHWHAALEFQRVVEGEMAFQANGTRFTVRRGEGVYLAGNTLHSGWLERAEDCEYQVVRFDPSLLGGLAGTRLFGNFIQPLLLDPRLAFLHLKFDVPWQAELLDRIGTFQAMTDTAEAGWELAAMERLFGIWRLIHRFAETLPKAEERIGDGLLPTRDIERMRRALTFIEAHHAERITLADIAASMTLSEGECCRLFRRMLRTSPMEYAISCRIRESLTLLAAGRLSVTEIAQRTGFSGSSYFTETFRKSMGMTPSEYRRRMGAE
ncbi:MAG: AraC family transcriptional regulator [Propionivibrio sp.]